MFSLVSVIILICAPSTTGSWEEKDGIKMEVPKRMAKLLMRITKQKLISIRESIRNGQSKSNRYCFIVIIIVKGLEILQFCSSH